MAKNPNASSQPSAPSVPDAFYKQLPLSSEAIAQRLKRVLELDSLLSQFKKSVENLNVALDKKVASVPGKGLSSNDFTDADKERLYKALTQHQSLDEYIKIAEISEKISQYLADHPEVGSNAMNEVSSWPTDARPKDNTIYRIGTVSSLNIAALPSDNIYGTLIYFTTAISGMTLSVPAGASWFGGRRSVEPNRSYVLLIADNHIGITEII